jgi:hypothetical protein
LKLYAIPSLGPVLGILLAYAHFLNIYTYFGFGSLA